MCHLHQIGRCSLEPSLKETVAWQGEVAQRAEEALPEAQAESEEPKGGVGRTTDSAIDLSPKGRFRERLYSKLSRLRVSQVGLGSFP